MDTILEIFTQYYRMFRGEADVPGTTDEEYTLGVALANNALSRWASYDGTYWQSLYDTNQSNGSGTQTITSGTSSYSAPTNMREAGGWVLIKDSSGNTQKHYPIINPEEVQFKADNATYAYFKGNPTAGFTLYLNPAPESSLNGMDIDYTYYKKPTEYTTTTTSTSEIPDPWFIVQNMLAQRFQIERNYGAYQIAKRDSEELLKAMQMDNNSGTWANPFQLPDNSGTNWGV